MNGRFLIQRELAVRSTEIDTLRQQNGLLINELGRVKDSTPQLESALLEISRLKEEVRATKVSIGRVQEELQPLKAENEVLHQQIQAQREEVAKFQELAEGKIKLEEELTQLKQAQLKQVDPRVLTMDNFDLAQRLDCQRRVFGKVKASRNDTQRHEFIRRHGGVFDERIKVRIIPSELLAPELPLKVPLDQSLEAYTRGQNGRVRAWFNNSIGTFHGRNWMLYRCECYPFWTASRVGICEMTENWEVIPSTWDFLLLRGRRAFEKSEDARFCDHNGTAIISYNDREKQRIGRLDLNMKVEDSTAIDLVGMQPQSCEKNWAYLSYGDELYAVYSICPHIVLKLNWSKATLVKKIDYVVDWPYGTPRGGTSCIPHKGKYYHFFHSSHEYEGDQDCIWSHVRRYHAGVVIYAGKPPFKPVAMSKFPLISAVDREMPKAGDDWHEHLACMHCVVFPAGAVRNKRDDGWVISMGIHDIHCGIAEIPDTVLEKNVH